MRDYLKEQGIAYEEWPDRLVVRGQALRGLTLDAYEALVLKAHRNDWAVERDLSTLTLHHMTQEELFEAKRPREVYRDFTVAAPVQGFTDAWRVVEMHTDYPSRDAAMQAVDTAHGVYGGLDGWLDSQEEQEDGTEG